LQLLAASSGFAASSRHGKQAYKPPVALLPPCWPAVPVGTFAVPPDERPSEKQW